jgi:hypothetical protein
VCNGLAVVSLAAALVVTAIAKPQLETFFDRYYNLTLRTTWNMELANYIGVLLVGSFIISVIGLIINSKRLKRKDDYIRATLVLSLVISLVAFGYFLRLAASQG